MTAQTRFQDLVQPNVRQAVAIISGGMDSTVLAYLLHRIGVGLTLLSFDYGQRHRTELGYARRTAEALNAEHHVVDLTGLLPLLSGSALTDDRTDVPDGHYIDVSMRATVVPNRNAIMLDVAVAQAVSVGGAVGQVGVDHREPPSTPTGVGSTSKVDVLYGRSTPPRTWEYRIGAWQPHCSRGPPPRAWRARATINLTPLGHRSTPTGVGSTA